MNSTQPKELPGKPTALPLVCLGLLSTVTEAPGESSLSRKVTDRLTQPMSRDQDDAARTRTCSPVVGLPSPTSWPATLPPPSPPSQPQASRSQRSDSISCPVGFHIHITSSGRPPGPPGLRRPSHPPPLPFAPLTALTPAFSSFLFSYLLAFCYSFHNN